MAKRISPEEKLLIQANLRRYGNQKETAKKFKRSLGSINAIWKEMQKLNNLSETDIKDKKTEETLLFLKQIDTNQRTHTQKIKDSIFDLMRDDTMSEIIIRFKHLLMNDEVCVATALDKGIDPFVRAIEMISRQNLNIAAYDIKKLELEIRKAELEIKKEQMKLQQLNAKGLNDEREEEDELENEVEKSLYEVLDKVVEQLSKENFDFNSLIETDSFKELPKTDEDLENEALNNV